MNNVTVGSVEITPLLDQWRSMLPLIEKLEMETSPRKLHVAVDLRVASRTGR